MKMSNLHKKLRAAVVHLEKGDPTEAVETMKAAQRLRMSERVQSWLKSALAEADTGDPQKAEHLLHAALFDLRSESKPPQAPNKSEALANFLETWSVCGMFDEIGRHLSCIECEALAALFVAHGDDETAIALRVAHAIHDERGDSPAHLKLKKIHGRAH